MWCNLVNQQCKLAVLIHSGVSPWVSASRFVLALINNLWKSLWQCTQAMLFCSSVCRFNYGSQFGRFEFVLLASLSQPEQRAGLSARMCTESHSPPLSLSLHPSVLLGEWLTEALPRQSCPKIHHFLLHPQRVLSSSKKAGVVFFFFFFVRKGFCILGQCLLVLCGPLHPGLRYECQTLKAFTFAEIRETVSAVVFHSPRFFNK